MLSTIIEGFGCIFLTHCSDYPEHCHYFVPEKAVINPHATGWQMLISSIILFGMVLISETYSSRKDSGRNMGCIGLLCAGSVFTFVALSTQ